MDNATFSRRNLDFILFEVLNMAALRQYEYFINHDSDTLQMVLDMAAGIADRHMRPYYVDSDRKPPVLENGKVAVHPGVHAFVRAFREAGLIAAPFPEAWGGMQLPKTVAAAAEFMLGSAHNSFVMYTDLAKGVANLILTFGSEAQKQYFLPNILSGKWLATMCLTEPQAGSSLSDIATTAYPQPDGAYKIKGDKIFISAGDHDVTENIIHLVLARIEGAPKGTKGISLFIVPKIDTGFNPSEGGSAAPPTSDIRPPKSNDVSSVAVYHKMGQKATPALHLAFGANDQCTGYLLGEAHRGLPQMFQMMNSARLGVGCGGIQIAAAAFCASLKYAEERLQGRRFHDKSALGEPVAILQHPDVRRMLLQQQAIVEGGLSFILQCYQYLDLEKAHADLPEQKAYYRNLLELLTPVAKTYGAEMGFVSANLGLQVLGGYGYTEDFELEQLVRDARIMPLYEGTTGIQGQALLGRQVLGSEGRALAAWYELVSRELAFARQHPVLGEYHAKMTGYLASFQTVTDRLLRVAAQGGLEMAIADATLYLEAFGLLNVGWQWLKAMSVFSDRITSDFAAGSLTAATGDDAFYQSKWRAMRFYFHYEMPSLLGLFERLADETTLTVWDETPFM